MSSRSGQNITSKGSRGFKVSATLSVKLDITNQSYTRLSRLSLLVGSNLDAGLLASEERQQERLRKVLDQEEADMLRAFATARVLVRLSIRFLESGLSQRLNGSRRANVYLRVVGSYCAD
jgi:hypothetical protein